jgi:hypothetical protein
MNECVFFSSYVSSNAKWLSLLVNREDVESPKLIDFIIITVNVTDREGAEFAKLALLEHLNPTLAPYQVAIVMTHSKSSLSMIIIIIIVVVLLLLCPMRYTQG